MKALKLDPQFAELLMDGAENATWRINDDKDLHVNDTITLISKVNPLEPASWKPVGRGQITSILEKQLGQIVQQDMMPSEQLLPLSELLKKYRTYYGQQVNEETPVKIVRFTYRKNTVGTDLAPATVGGEYKLYTDGGSRGNPGPSAAGYVLMDMEDTIIKSGGLFLGVTTNNQAEYQSLKMGLEVAHKRNADTVHVFMDSTLVINQMKAIYKVKNTDLIPVHNTVKDIASRIPHVTFTYVPREHNRRADTIVNEILDIQAPLTKK